MFPSVDNLAWLAPPPTLALGFWVGLMAVLFALVSAFMMLVILIQRPRGGGLSGAFGGVGGSAQTAFGAKTGDVLTWFTVGCFIAFLLLAISLNWMTKPDTQPLPTLGAPVNSAPATSAPPSGDATSPAPIAPADPDAALSGPEDLGDAAPPAEP